MLIDTHTHLYSEEFNDDRAAAVQRAVDAGVGLMLLPAIDSGSTAAQQQLATAYPALFREMAGLHPTSVNEDYEQELRLVEHLLDADPTRYVAIGEIGIDLYWDTTYRQQQLEALARQLQLADSYGKPVALHLRNAYADFFDLIEAEHRIELRGVMHCFSGSLDDAQRAIDMGLYLGIGGTLTYKRSTLPDTVRAIGLSHILLETDAPYLAPVPRRGRRNESAYIVYVAQALAAILGVDEEEVASVTTANARKLFSL